MRLRAGWNFCDCQPLRVLLRKTHLPLQGRRVARVGATPQYVARPPSSTVPPFPQEEGGFALYLQFCIIRYVLLTFIKPFMQCCQFAQK